MDVQDIDTPALLIDLNVLEKNIATVANFFKGRKCNVRPHVKGHKIPAIAHKQLEAGAKGICTAKLSEAELMASTGITDILITNEIVTSYKIERLARLSRECSVTVAVDNPKNLEELSRVAREYGSEIGVLVDINVGQFGKMDGVLDRCGVLPGKPGVSLAKKVVETKGVKFMGLMGYEGGMGRFLEFEKRKEAVHHALRPLVETANTIRETGIEVGSVSAGSTGSWNITGDCPGITEIQAGSYVLMDLNYSRLEGIGDLGIALSVLTTVISTPYEGKVITDIGQKGTCTASTGTGTGGMPKVKGMLGVEVQKLNVEHCHLTVKDTSTKIEIGDKLELIPYEVDTTVNLYDKAYATRHGKVYAEWKITGRGLSQ